MNTRPSVLAGAIPRIGHDEAMTVAAHENDRFQQLIDAIEPGQWELPTDCSRWDVRDVTVHVIAVAEATASPREFIRQKRAGRPLTREVGGHHWVDGMNEAQLRARREWRPDSLPDRWHLACTAALTIRRRLPRPVRALPLLRLGRHRKPLAYLYDTGFTRDTWMHRIDISRALGQAMAVTAQHDGRIVADIVAEWATTHDEEFALDLTGPAGGIYVRARETTIELLQIDAIDFCRILSGRGTPTGVLRHPLPL